MNNGYAHVEDPGMCEALEQSLDQQRHKALVKEWQSVSVSDRRKVYYAVREDLRKQGYLLDKQNRSSDPRHWTGDFLHRCIEVARIYESIRFSKEQH